MFLPVSKEDMELRGWDSLDFIFITGEAYMDHPSLGQSVITRLLEAEGFKVGVIAQPKSNKDYMKLGTPNIAFLVSSGTIDSMVNNYTVNKKKRNDDVYSPGKGNNRPDRATIVYSNKVKELFPDSFVMIGGLEASLRRFSHYDYWNDEVMSSILVDSKADLLMFGMGEKTYWEMSAFLKRSVPVNKLKNLRGTCYLATREELDKLMTKEEVLVLPSDKECKESKKKYAEAFKIQYENQDAINGKMMAQMQDNGMYLIQNKMQFPLTQKELDRVYEWPYERTYHPMYEKEGGVRALDEVMFSLTSQRGCFGGCNFCAITFHQGRTIQSRSKESLVREAELMTKMPNFKGYIHDVGGPTANFRRPSCDNQAKCGVCKKRQCLFPTPCKNVKFDHSEYLDILRTIRNIKGIKKVFVRSGIRYDYLMNDKDDTFFKELCQYHISGQLKVAPEHISNNVLRQMGKPDKEIYLKFAEKYKRINDKLGMDQYLVPYLMSSHPGSTLKDAIELAEYLRDINHQPEQVQDFYPTPGTVSTCMYYTGINPLTGEEVYVPKTDEEKRMQRALLQYKNPNNYDIVYKALVKAGRLDLIGYDKKCLIRPKRESDKYTHINGQTKGGRTYSKNNRSKKDGTVKGKYSKKR